MGIINVPVSGGTSEQNRLIYQGTRSVVAAPILAFASLANGQTFVTITPSGAADSRTINAALAASTDRPTFCAALALELNAAGTTAYVWTVNVTSDGLIGTAKTPGSAFNRAPTGTALVGAVGSISTFGENAAISDTGLALTDSRTKTIYVMDAPYNASGSAVTTAASAANAPGNTIQVVDASTFTAGHGVWSKGQGVAGANYVGQVTSVQGNTIYVSPPTSTEAIPLTTVTSGTNVAGTTINLVSAANAFVLRGVTIAGAGPEGSNYRGVLKVVSGNAVVVTPATSTSVPAGTAVLLDSIMHDDTAAIQGAIDTAAEYPSSTILGDGYTRVNGPFQDLSGANAMLTLPSIYYGGGLLAKNITFKGLSKPTFSDQGYSTGGWIIKTDSVAPDAGGAILSGYNADSISWGPKTSCFVTFEDVTFRTYSNPQINGVNCLNVGRSQSRGHFVVDTGGQTEPQYAWDWYGYQSSGAACVPPDLHENITIQGFNRGVVAGERFHCNYLYTSFCQYPLVSAGFDVSVNKMLVDWAYSVITGTGGNLKIDFLTIDQVITYLLDDPTNLLKGEVLYCVLNGASAINGGAHVVVRTLGNAPTTQIKNGTASAPSVSWGTDVTCGLYHSGTGATGLVGLAVNGGAVLSATVDGVGVGPGSSVSPSYGLNVFSTGSQGAAINCQPSGVSAGAGAGSIVMLSGPYTGTTNTAFATIKGAKETATAGEFGGYFSIATRVNGGALTDYLRVTSLGNILLGGLTAAGAAAQKCLALSNSAVAPSASVDIAHIYAADTAGAGTCGLAIWAEVAAAAAASTASTHKIPIMYNGTKYNLLVTTV
jgi:hypothetical protein